MVKKLVTIDIQDKNLKSSAKSVASKKAKVEETKEIENFGIVEINNSSSAKKVKNNAERGFEKNVSGEAKKTVKSQISQVEDYFDFSFRKTDVEENAKLVEKTVKTATKSTKTEKKTATTKKVVAKKQSVAKEKEIPAIKIEEIVTQNLKEEQKENVSDSVNFDNEANQVIRIARIGSLFDCDIRMMNA